MRRAVFRTEHEHAAAVAAAVRPDNTPQMTTEVQWRTPEASPEDGATVGTVVTTVERETTSGLRATADDYVTNLAVAAQITTDVHDTQQ